jgi:hypothetical protein
MIKYLSPSSISTYRKDKREFYLRYMCAERPPKLPQTAPMSVGSSFDAYVKGYISDKLFGIKGEFERLFEKGVETQNRDFALVAGKHAFGCYIHTGALAALMMELERAVDTPHMEFEVSGEICSGGSRVPLKGFPDLRYRSKSGVQVILDWKVMGFCSTSNTSPWRGYMICRDMDGGTKTHKEFKGYDFSGLRVNVGGTMDSLIPMYAHQVCIYGWLLTNVCEGRDATFEKFVAAIDQLVCKGFDGTNVNTVDIRVASHRNIVTTVYQQALYAEIAMIWEAVLADKILPEEQQAMLREQYKAFEDGDEVFFELTRGQDTGW